jgi:hypothetical protein
MNVMKSKVSCVILVASFYSWANLVFADAKNEKHQVKDDQNKYEYILPEKLPSCPPDHVCRVTVSPSRPGGPGSGGTGMGRSDRDANEIRIDTRAINMDRSYQKSE